MLDEDVEKRITAEQALEHPWFKINVEQECQAKHAIDRMQNQSEYENQRKIIHMQKNPLISQTPVLAGVIRDGAPPETPFLTSEGGALVNQTPVMKRFSILRPAG